MPAIKLTKTVIWRIKASDPSGRQAITWDAELRGMGGLASGTTSANFFGRGPHRLEDLQRGGTWVARPRPHQLSAAAGPGSPISWRSRWRNGPKRTGKTLPQPVPPIDSMPWPCRCPPPCRPGALNGVKRKKPPAWRPPVF